METTEGKKLDHSHCRDGLTIQRGTQQCQPSPSKGSRCETVVKTVTVILQCYDDGGGLVEGGGLQVAGIEVGMVNGLVELEIVVVGI